MRHTKLLVLLCLCVAVSLCRAQEDTQLYTINQWKLAEGDQDAFLEEISGVVELYQEKSNFDWDFYRYDNGTIESVMPTKNYGYIDRFEASFNRALLTVPEEAREALLDVAKLERMIVSARDLVLMHVPELSYTPEGDEAMTGKWNFFRLERYRMNCTRDEAGEHIRKMKGMMEAAGSPLQYAVYFYSFGGDYFEFEVAYPARDAADLERRGTLHEELLSKKDGGAALAAWNERSEELADLLETSHATRIKEFSKEATKPYGQYFAVLLETLVPGKQDEYLKATKAEIEAARDAGSEFYWGSSIRDDGQVMHFFPINNPNDLGEFSDRWGDHSALVGEEKLKEVWENYRGTMIDQHFVIMYRSDSLSYYPEGTNSENPAWKAVYYEYDIHEREAVMEFVKKSKTLFAEKQTKVPYEIWFNTIGRPGNQLIVVDWGKSKADIDSSVATAMEQLGEDGKAWAEELESLLKEVDVVYGRLAPELSRMPEE